MHESLLGPITAPFELTHAPTASSPAVRVAEGLVGIASVSASVSADAVSQYSALAVRLHRARESRRLRTVMVASAAEGEGKSLTAANLALTFSRSYCQSVVLIDANLKRPSLHTLFGIENVNGLNECLSIGDFTSPLTVPVSAQLSLLPAGQPDQDPIASLPSERMRKVLDDLSDRFEWVILDGPPLSALPHASSLSEMVDGILLVVGAGRTPLRLVDNAIRALGRDRIVGMVLNHSGGP